MLYFRQNPKNQSDKLRVRVHIITWLYDCIKQCVILMCYVFKSTAESAIYVSKNAELVLVLVLAACSALLPEMAAKITGYVCGDMVTDRS